MHTVSLTQRERKQSESEIIMATYDLTPRIAPNLDRHLVFPILEFLQERRLYEDGQILKEKIELLNKTNMVDYAMDIHKSLYHTEDVPQGPTFFTSLSIYMCVCVCVCVWKLGFLIVFCVCVCRYDWQEGGGGGEIEGIGGGGGAAGGVLAES